MTEISKINFRIWALCQDNMRRGENIDASLAREDDARRAAMIMKSRFPNTPDFDPEPYESYRAFVRKETAKADAEIAALRERLKELHNNGAEV